MNVTAVSPTDLGDLRVFKAGPLVPSASVLNFSSGQTRANNTIVSLGEGGGITVQNDMVPGSGGSVHVLIDVLGYFR